MRVPLLSIVSIHKSTGLLMAGLIPLRLALALIARRPGPLPGPAGLSTKLGHIAAGASHVAMYALMVGLPTSGIIMGYYSGKGECGLFDACDKGYKGI